MTVFWVIPRISEEKKNHKDFVTMIETAFCFRHLRYDIYVETCVSICTKSSFRVESLNVMFSMKSNFERILLLQRYIFTIHFLANKLMEPSHGW